MIVTAFVVVVDAALTHAPAEIAKGAPGAAL